jgi:hypothetical protein
MEIRINIARDIQEGDSRMRDNRGKNSRGLNNGGINNKRGKRV